jgi:LemA protein
MKTTLIAVLVTGAVLLFWVIGAYNRLVVLRNAIASAWAKVQEALSQRASGVSVLTNLLREPMAAELGALDTWLATHAEAVKAASALAGKPVNEAGAQAWVAAESALGAAASRLLALLEQHPDLSQREGLADALAAWREGQAKLPFARQFFNNAAKDYNDAVAVFPTRIVAHGFGLQRAGLL